MKRIGDVLKISTFEDGKIIDQGIGTIITFGKVWCGTTQNWVRTPIIAVGEKRYLGSECIVESV